jgi:hypothetical protein
MNRLERSEFLCPACSNSLSKNVPGFVEYFCEEQGIDGG